ncbi:Histone acetyltransferase [Globisporangium polare]
MSVPPQSMPPVPQYASSTASLTPTTTSTTTMNTNSAGANMTAGPASTVRQTDAVNLTSNNNSTDPNAGAGANSSAASGAVPGGVGGDWRDKDADRSARQQIARIILTLIMKSANRPASVNYNPREIARRLEHTLYMSASSRDEYSNVQTLKARLQQALDNSRRRQMQQQQQQQPSPTASQADGLQQQQQVQAQNQAQQLQQQQQQLQLLHRQQQQMAALQQRNSFQGIPFSASPVQMPQQALSSQPLQMPMSVSQMPGNSQAGLSMSSGVTTSTTSATSAAAGQSGGSSILDELEREADEMANGISDEPIAMPESELQGASSIPVSMAGGSNFAGMATSTAASNLPSSTLTSQFNPVALSMPPEISAGLATSSVNASGGFGMQTNPTMVGVPGANGNSNLYHGMNLTGPQLQQIQQLQQMQTLRRMQQLQQLQQQQQQQQQQNAANMGMNPAVADERGIHRPEARGAEAASDSTEARANLHDK